MRTHYPYLFLLLLNFCSFQATADAQRTSSSEALLAWKSSLYNPVALISWSPSNSTNSTIKHCNWYGVICDAKDAITVLNLAYAGLNGTIEKLDFGSFPSLTYINFSGNYLLHGEIPESISYLYNLVSLDLSNNGLTGSIPRSVKNVTRLKYLNLGMNGITGKIPDEIGSLINLVEINLMCNHFNGTIPENIGNLTELNVLHLGLNNLTGRIPLKLANLGTLKVLNLSTNGLSVPIPSYIANFSKLQSLDLSGLDLHGPIQDLFFGSDGIRTWNFSSLPNLQYLFIRDNFLSGSLPSFFCNLDSLIALDLSRNRISGEIPLCWWEIKNLEMMILESNELSGEIPISSGRMPPLLSVHLANNSLVGRFPSALINCRNLVVLDLGKNGLHGEIPEWLGYNLSSLKILSLRENMFNGTIPVLQNLGKLQLMDLSGNDFVGIIPRSIGNLTSMTVKQILDKIDGSRFTYMESISITWKGSELSFQQNLALVNGIDLSRNALTGEIPAELTNLLGLLFLNLSNNYLTGFVPERIGDLQELEFLDLSDNEISGRIPQSVAKITSLSFLNLSNNRLSGEIPEGSQMQTFDDPQIYSGNDGLCGFPLDKSCEKDDSTDRNGGVTDENDHSNTEEIVWLFGFLMLGFCSGFWTFFGVLIMKNDLRLWYFCRIDRMQERVLNTMVRIFSKNSSNSVINEEFNSSYDQFSDALELNWYCSEGTTSNVQPQIK